MSGRRELKRYRLLLPASEAFFDLRSFSVGGSEGGPGTKLVEQYRCRGTRFICGRVFIPVDGVVKKHWRSLVPAKRS